MSTIKDELQNIICRDEQTGTRSELQKTQSFLSGYAKTGSAIEKQQRFKDKETAALIVFAKNEGLFFDSLIPLSKFIGEGAEQKVYRFDGDCVIKTNKSVFYEKWFDYFNSLLIHNFFFPASAYTFLGFKLIDNELNAVVKQEFIIANEKTNLDIVKQFLEYNGFKNKRANDYFSPETGLILEDLHDENVVSVSGLLYFIDTVFYLTDAFYSK